MAFSAVSDYKIGRFAGTHVGWVKALDMPHLQKRPGPLGQLHELVGLGQGGGHGLLEEDVSSLLEGPPGQAVVAYQGDLVLGGGIIGE